MNDHERARERKRANSCGLVNPCRIRQSEGRELRCDRTRQGTNRCENTFPGSEVATTQPCFRCVSSSIVSMMSGPEIPTGVHPVILPRAQCTIHRLPPWLDIVCEMPTEQRISLGPEKHPFTPLLSVRSRGKFDRKFTLLGSKVPSKGFILAAVFEFLYPWLAWPSLLV